MKAILMGVAVAAGAMAAPAWADNPMKVCGAQYQAAKAAGKLPAGQTWNQFLAQCRTTLPSAAAASPTAAAKPTAAAAPAPAAKTAAAHLPASSSPAMQAMHDRQRKCGQMWSADKAAGKIPAGQKWPQYWSACNTKLKG